MYTCPRCGNELKYVSDYNAWWCENCNLYWPEASLNPQNQFNGGTTYHPSGDAVPSETAIPYSTKEAVQPTTNQDIYSAPNQTYDSYPQQPSTYYGYSQPSPPKKKGKTGFIILTVLLTLMLLATAVWGAGVKNAYDNLADEHSKLENQYSDMNDNYSKLENQYGNLSSDYSDLNSDYNQLNSAHATLESDYNNLDSQYNSLESNYTELNGKYTKETTMRTGNLLQTFYQDVRADYFPSEYSKKASFAAKLAGHGIGKNYWSNLDNNFYENSYESYGKHIHSYTEAKNELSKVYKLIGISSGDSQVTKIDKILKFVNSNIHGEADNQESFHAPMETITLKSGDCDDYSILVGALFEMAGIKTAIALNNPDKNGGTGHVFLVVQVSNTEGKLDYGYKDLTDKGLSSGWWYIIEPQLKLEDQHEYISSHENRYTLEYAAEI